MWKFLPGQLRAARERAGLTQQSAAERLGVSQAYVAMMERGRRVVTAPLGARLFRLYRLPPIALPLEQDRRVAWDSASLARAVANLGYPPFRHLRKGRLLNPATVLFAAITRNDLEVRIVESLPWLALEYQDLDWEWLTRQAKLQDSQNRLGFILSLSRTLVEGRTMEATASKFRAVEQALDHARLAREDTLCQESLSEAERQWLRKERSADAVHWNLLTDLNPEVLPYAA